MCLLFIRHTIHAMAEKLSSNFERHPSENTNDTESWKLKERDGCCAAWLTVLGSILVYYASFGVMNSFGFFQDYYSKDFLKDTNASTIAFIGTLQMALMNLLAAISGALCDRYGVKVRLHPTIFKVTTNKTISISTLVQVPALCWH
jgi:MCP family monocarboxylic acid transporter-like MFS transporter 10